jgi:uncharacterized membrane protein YqjE
MTDRPERNAAKGEGIVPAIQNLTDGVIDLVQNQVELVRVEFRREATEAGERGGTLLLYAGLALMGYGLINIALILLAGWLGGLPAMFVTALLLGLAHLGFGATLARRKVEGFQQQQERLERKTRRITGQDQPQLEESSDS